MAKHSRLLLTGNTLESKEEKLEEKKQMNKPINTSAIYWIINVSNIFS